MRLLMKGDVPAWASAAFQAIEKSVTTLEALVGGVKTPLSPRRMQLPESREDSPNKREIRWNQETHSIEVYDEQGKTWLSVTLT